jgi:hypothetical protein
MQKKSYRGYRSFQYLEPGVDYRLFELDREIGRVEPYAYPVSEAQEARVQRLLAENAIVSIHDHSTISPKDMGQIFDYVRQGREWTGYDLSTSPSWWASNTLASGRIRFSEIHVGLLDVFADQLSIGSAHAGPAYTEVE